MTPFARLADLVAAHGSAALATVREAKGSTPREAGAWMAVRPDGAFHGTIGGGELEWRALAAARRALAAGRGPALVLDQSLGPDLGQCCGGRVILTIETFDAADLPALRALAEARGPLRARVDADGRVSRGPGAEGWIEGGGPAPTPLLLFGAGHVGRALVLALAPLPFSVRWIDGRAEAFPTHVPANAEPVATDEPRLALAQAPAGAFVLVMTHSHPLDLAVTAAALAREDLPFVGLIGSATKRARFERRLREIGVPDARVRALVCPIGAPGIGGKEPAVIAAATAAQLLQAREAAHSGRDP